MQLSASQLQSQHKALIDALKRGETVEITYHGQTLGIVQPVKPSVTTKEQENAMASFLSRAANGPTIRLKSQHRNGRCAHCRNGS